MEKKKRRGSIPHMISVQHKQTIASNGYNLQTYQGNPQRKKKSAQSDMQQIFLLMTKT